jgi:NitT/TauT family transport system ATP-binding protein
MLSINNLSISFGDLHVLDSISFSVGRNEIVSIVGPSGCGKSTLLRCIAGLISPSSGEIIFDYGEVSALPQVSLVFQRPVLLEWLTIGENLRLPYKLGNREYDSKAVADSLKAFNLEGFTDYFPREISIGMAQRVCLARAIAEDSRLLLLDEPFSGLDEITRQNVSIALSNTLKNRSAIFVTHSIHDAVFLGHRVIVLSQWPARISYEVTIDLPMQRTDELWLSDKLNPYLTSIRNQMTKNL